MKTPDQTCHKPQPALGYGMLLRRLGLCLGLLVVACVLGMVLSSRGLAPTTGHVLWQMRLPRVLMALLAGAALAAAGVTFQALLGNPLADPYIIGVSGGAALGGTLALLLAGGAMLVPALSFGGAMAAAFGAWAFARRMGGGTFQILMTGVVINAFAASSISFIKTMVSAAKAQEILFWLMGTLGYPTWHELAISGGCVAVGGTVLAVLAQRFNALTFGDASAAAMGVNVGRTRGAAFVAGSLVVGAVVAQVGMIGFLGLVVPHLLRLLWGPDHRLLLPGAALVGAAVLVLADSLARLSFLAIGTTLPVGVITSFLGGPFFIILLLKNRHGFAAA